MLAILGCREDEIEFIPTDDTETMSTEIMSTVDLTGFIVDPDGNPVSDATVLYKAEEAVTDDTGFYILENVQASSVHATLEVTKLGYFSGSRTFRTQNAGTLFHRTTLVPLGDPMSLSGGSGSVASDLVSLDFPENSVMDELTGEILSLIHI